MERRSASPSSGSSKVKPNRRSHKACNHCRTHRIKCVPVEGEERCKRCLDSDMPCDKASAPPKDDRPRRRFLYKNARALSQSQGVEAAYLGSSSLALLAWKYAPQRPDVLDKFRVIDDRHELYRGSIGGLEQDGLLVGQSEDEVVKLERPTLISMSMARSRLVQELGAETVLTALYETCRDRIIPLFPVISVSESLLADTASEDHVAKYVSVDRHPPTPLPHIVRMIHCAIASLARNVPMRVRESVLAALHRLLSGPEMAKITATRCLGSIQVMMLLSMADELNGSNLVDANEAVWQNVGSAIRMGIGIGLHRNVSPSQIPYFQLNRRFRVWGACICMDRWLSLRTGRGCSIDLGECDAPLPRNYADGIREGDQWVHKDPVFPCFRFLAEFTQLSILLGRAHRLIGSPLGLQSADEVSFILLQLNIDTWIAQLPTSWPYSANLQLRQAPYLMNLFIIALEFTLQRCFLWPTGPIPLHITYRPSRERWLSLCQRAEQAIYWLNTPDGAFYLDVWSNTTYPAFCCVIIYLKAFEESSDLHHKWLLDMADTVIQQWTVQAPNSPIRSRIGAMSGLLRSVAEAKDSTPVTLEDLFHTESNSESDHDPLGLNQMGLDQMVLPPMWFEQV